MRNYDTSSEVEARALGASGSELRYAPRERMGCILVKDFPSLGRLASLRFLEWLQKNPEGALSLPTGKTPETFMKWTLRFLLNWDRPDVRRELESGGVDPARKPEMRGYHFVQIDEFYPMNPAQENSFAFYIRAHYLEAFGFDPARALLMNTWTLGAPAGRNLGDLFEGAPFDLSLRHRRPADEREKLQADAIAAADQFASDYEERVAALGGIGFFLGGLGPDGHVGFNIRGSDPHSTTRLTPINYETAAAAAGDLGGIEISRNKAVITVGLATITRNPSATAIIFVSGEAKARVAADAVEQPPSIAFPATALHVLPAARMYLTHGAASLLIERRRLNILKRGSLSEVERVRIIVDAAVGSAKRLDQLAPSDLKTSPLGDLIDPADLSRVCAETADVLRERVARGLENLDGATFLHTAPHHDDIMLGYLPYIVHQVRSPRSSHYFAILTSGFTAVTNTYAMEQIRNLRDHLDAGLLDALISTGCFHLDHKDARNRDVFRYLDGVAAGNDDMRREGEARRMMRNMAELLHTDDCASVREHLDNLLAELERAYPGKKDSRDIQTLKGMIREWEEELAWAHVGIPSEHVFHLRLGFYTGDMFTPQPTPERDVLPIQRLLDRVSPDVLTVALDPEGSGPDTHYKVLQATSEAVKAYLKARPEKRLTILGYRNVWQRFHPAEANVFVPLSMNGMAILRTTFNVCFGSQRAASFPSYAHDGPFCDLAQRIMVDQYAAVMNCLGPEFFQESSSPQLRATRGLNFLRMMTPEELFYEADELKKAIE